MKKIKFISVFTIIALLGGMVFMNACSKQELGEQNDPQEQEYQMSAEDISFQNKFVEFRDKVNYIRENPGYKSGEVMSADDAILHIESLFNATYSFTQERYGRTETNKATIEVPVSVNDEVTVDDIALTFTEIIGIVTQFYHQCDFNQKGFLLLDLERGATTNNQLEISVRSVVGEKNDIWIPFGQYDYWWYGEELGDCELNNTGTDAAKKIQEAVNFHKPLVSPPPGYKFVYDNYVTIL